MVLSLSGLVLSGLPYSVHLVLPTLLLLDLSATSNFFAVLFRRPFFYISVNFYTHFQRDVVKLVMD
jgi:hypothetical protein